MDASGGSREEKDDDHQNFDKLGCKNVEGSDKKSSDEVPQSSDQMEVVEDGLGRMSLNNDRVVENSDAEFIASQMDITGSVGVVGGQFGNELVQSSDTGNIESSSHGMASDHGNLLDQSTSGTQPVLHSESSDVLGEGQGQGADEKSSDEVPDQSSDQMEFVEDATGGRGRMFGNNDRVVENSDAEFIANQMNTSGSLSVVGGQSGNELVQSSDTGNIESSSHAMASDHGNLLGQSTSGTQLVLHSESSNVLGEGQGQGTDEKSSDEVPDQSSDQMEFVEDGHGRMFGNNDRVGENSNAELIASQMDIRGSVGVVDGQFGNELVQSSDTGNMESSRLGMALDHGNLLGQSTSGTQPVLHSESSNVLGQDHSQGTGGTESVLHSESSNGHGQGQQGMYPQIAPLPVARSHGKYSLVLSTEKSPPKVYFFGNPAQVNPPVTPPVQSESGTGFFMPRRVPEHYMSISSDASAVTVDRQTGFFGTLRNPFFPIIAPEIVGLPVNADMTVEARDSEEVGSDQGSTTGDS